MYTALYGPITMAIAWDSGIWRLARQKFWIAVISGLAHGKHLWSWSPAFVKSTRDFEKNVLEIWNGTSYFRTKKRY